MTKTPGQIAYETEVEIYPCYHDGTPRHAWDKLPDHAKRTWEDNPTPRKFPEGMYQKKCK